MHELLRQYAREKLVEADEAEGIYERHLNFFLELAQAAEPQLKGAEQKARLLHLEHEHDNLRAALTWALERGEAEKAARISASLWRFWWVQGHLSEGRRWLEQSLASPGALSASTRAKALHGAGVLAYGLGDYMGAIAAIEECSALQREMEDTGGLADSLNTLGAVAMDQGDPKRAQVFCAESLALSRVMRDEQRSALSLNNLANAAYDEGDFAAADILRQESLALSRKHGDKDGIATSLINLGWAALLQGDDERAA